MSSTNHTTNYNLPQWVGTDKPAWLGDMNPAFSAIDTQMKANNTLAQQGVTDASTADGKAVHAQADATQALTDAGTAQTTANGASAEARRVGQLVDGLITKLTLSDITTCDISSTGNHGSIKLTLAQSTDGSVFKVYGYFNLYNSSSSQATGLFTISNITVDSQTVACVDTGLVLNATPDNAYMIAPAGTCFIRDDANTSAYRLTNDTQNIIIVGTNGHIFVTNGTVLSNGNVPAKTTLKHYFNPCVYFNTNFGDTPESA